MSISLHSPYVRVLPQKMMKSQPCIHCGLTPSVTIAKNLSAHAHGTKFRGGNFSTFQNFCGMHKDQRQWATDLHVCKRMPGSDLRTGTFYQMWVTVGYITCSVKGVLVTHLEGRTFYLVGMTFYLVGMTYCLVGMIC